MIRIVLKSGLTDCAGYSMANILVSNIYHMLAYAFQVLHQTNYDEIATETFDHVQDLFAAILSKGIAQQLKQGLHREYISKTEELSVMRGKLDIQGTVNNHIQNRRRLTCEYDELSVNNVFNQILKTTVFLLLKESDVREESKSSLKKEMLFFSEVDEIEPLQIRWDHLCFHRNNQSYRMLISICQLVLEGLLLTNEKGEMKLAQFLDEQRMCRLYEKFILEFYRKEVPEVRASAPKIEWQLSEGVSTMLPAMQSDIVLRLGEKTLIIDAKYYSHSTQEQYGKQTLHSANVYQIFAYVVNEDVGSTGNVAGLLLYAKTDEEVTPDMDVKINKNRIMAKSLDLNCDFSLISAQLKSIARDYFRY